MPKRTTRNYKNLLTGIALGFGLFSSGAITQSILQSRKNQENKVFNYSSPERNSERAEFWVENARSTIGTPLSSTYPSLTRMMNELVYKGTDEQRAAFYLGMAAVHRRQFLVGTFNPEPMTPEESERHLRRTYGIERGPLQEAREFFEDLLP